MMKRKKVKIRTNLGLLMDLELHFLVAWQGLEATPVLIIFNVKRLLIDPCYCGKYISFFSALALTLVSINI